MKVGASGALCRVRAFGQEIASGTLDLLFPPACTYCGSCGAIDPSSTLCPLCLAAEEVFSAEDRLCPRCALPLTIDDIHTEPACRRCENVVFRFRGAASAGRYEGRLRALIRAYKYEARLHVKGHLAELLSRAYGTSNFFEKAEAAAPVPPARSRTREKGYDPVGELARAFAESEGLALLGGAISRVRDTRPLAGLSARERRSETLGAFAPAAKLDGQNVILVDDIMTTGATLDDAARALIAAGAGRVYALTVARDVI
ncbi:MAG TPA: ComF family protein [Planctomycetes bacterium]|nr:ComF family protein [Planctomycetota bacterium]